MCKIPLGTKTFECGLCRDLRVCLIVFVQCSQPTTKMVRNSRLLPIHMYTRAFLLEHPSSFHSHLSLSTHQGHPHLPLPLPHSAPSSTSTHPAGSRGLCTHTPPFLGVHSPFRFNPRVLHGDTQCLMRCHQSHLISAPSPVSPNHVSSLCQQLVQGRAPGSPAPPSKPDAEQSLSGKTKSSPRDAVDPERIPSTGHIQPPISQTREKTSLLFGH